MTGETSINRKNLASWRIVITKFNQGILTQPLRVLGYRSLGRRHCLGVKEDKAGGSAPVDCTASRRGH